MATFGKATFDALSYAAFRPTYPRALYDHVFRFHAAGAARGGRWDTAVDLGCGTGQATHALTPFKQIIGVDPSAGMVDAARQGASGEVGKRITYVQSPAEDLGFLEDGSVDVMIAAQSGHWFDWPRMWPEAARVLRPQGTFAIWNYSEMRFPKHPSLTPLVTHFFQGKDPQTSVGPYWEPGRAILEGHLVGVPDARDVVPGVFSELTREYFTGGHYPDLPARPILMRARMSWGALYAYIRTCSALHTFLERHPEDAGPEGDLGRRFWRALVQEAGKDVGGEVREQDEIDVEWPLAMILVRKA